MFDKRIEKQCIGCPAFYEEHTNNEYGNEYDQGCILERDVDKICLLDFAPHCIVNALINARDKRFAKKWAKENLEEEQP